MLNNVIWLDLEYSDLDPKVGEILEISLAVAKQSDPLTIEKRYTAVLDCNTDPRTWDPFVLNMHSKNGLLVEATKQRNLSKSSHTPRLEQVAQTVLRYLPTISRDPRELYTLAGNSVHTDWNYLKVHMPAVAAKFSHRLLDVSAAALFCRSLGHVPPKHEPAHRAEGDVDASIAQFAQLQKFVREYGWAQRLPTVNEQPEDGPPNVPTADEARQLLFGANV